MRRHAKASTAGSKKTGRAMLPLGAFAAIIAAFALIAALADAAVPTATTESASNVEKTTATLNGTVNPQGALLEECKFEYGTTTSYGQSQACNLTPAEIGTGSSGVAVNADLTGLVIGTTYHFRLVAKNSEGTSNGSDQTFKTLSPPTVEAFASNVVYTEATLNALVDPEGFATTYKFEWGPTAAYGSSTVEAAAGSDKAVHSFSHSLEGLAQGTTYHYRVVATNSIGTTETPDHTLLTYAHEPQNTNCSNQSFRTGPAATLPDCRAYEMVSPVDKSGADIMPPENVTGFAMSSDQAALDGDKMAFTTRQAFGDALSNLSANEFIASRGADGWTTHGINPPHESNQELSTNVASLPGRYSAFSEDLSRGFLYDDAKPPLTPDAIPNTYNFYLRDNETGTYKALTTEFLSGDYSLSGAGLMGYSKDGSHTVFATRAQLTPDAEPGGVSQLYDYHDGQLSLVNILPNGETAGPSSAGAAGDEYNVEKGETAHAVSDDGSRIFWTAGLSESGGDKGVGTIYARIDDEQTIPVSGSVPSGSKADYWAASADGSKVVFSVDENLYEFDVDTETPTLIAGEVDPYHGVLGAGEDASSVYFLSKEALAAGATAGKPNLYRDHEGAEIFVATLATGDESGPAPTAQNGAGGNFMFYDFSQVSANGTHVVFDSRAALTGYDNHSLGNGEAAIEVYDYDASTGRLVCISCNPGGGRPQTRALWQPYDFVNLREYIEEENFTSGKFGVQAAAWLPTPRRGTHIPRMVSEEGGRVFFNSYDALLPGDTNGAQDVYEWEAQGIGGCEKPDGCLSLISTGESPKESTFVDASEGGRDVFFRTSAGIDPEDPGLIDIYDARVGGGLPPRSEPPECAGDACQSPPAAPIEPTPASAGFRGQGNPKPTAKRRRVCVTRKRHRKTASRGAHRRARQATASKHCKRNNRRAGR